MEIVVKQFDELTLDELYRILKLRSEIFVVEQNCVYQDVDDKDRKAIHVFMKEDDEDIHTYLRVMDKGVTFENDACIGRVVTKIRRKGYGTILMKKGIEIALERFNVDTIRIEAQCYAGPFYENVGFKQISEPYLLDDIDHMEMLWEK